MLLGDDVGAVVAQRIGAVTSAPLGGTLRQSGPSCSDLLVLNAIGIFFRIPAGDATAHLLDLRMLFS